MCNDKLYAHNQSETIDYNLHELTQIIPFLSFVRLQIHVCTMYMHTEHTYQSHSRTQLQTCTKAMNYYIIQNLWNCFTLFFTSLAIGRVTFIHTNTPVLIYAHTHSCWMCRDDKNRFSMMIYHIYIGTIIIIVCSICEVTATFIKRCHFRYFLVLVHNVQIRCAGGIRYLAHCIWRLLFWQRINFNTFILFQFN